MSEQDEELIEEQKEEEVKTTEAESDEAEELVYFSRSLKESSCAFRMTDQSNVLAAVCFPVSIRRRHRSRSDRIRCICLRRSS